MVPVYQVAIPCGTDSGGGTAKTVPVDAVQFKGGLRGATRIERPKIITQIDLS